ncbi:FAD-dependent monooxygenase [Sulfitobacter aestuariivivens]|uniref:FAD-dependent monooxygenase n=1 Tax=Sulfitobacter aestuariivivens TaxID=2766981 RepID=A0A927HCY4_9RHOB|nr:FAD-dependent monooxygenase [Sulfitobacter aestuariivivens]MBD3663082.1 FAD-dependent monooxygenase [Sulfitobacter aestuariivivens]
MAISNAIVVGGGIGGLAVAAALGQRGVAVTLYEQAPSLDEVGAGLQISPNGLAVLRALGVEAALRQKGAVRAGAVQLADHKTGRSVARMDLARLGEKHGYFFLHRADLVDVLAGAAKRANVTFALGHTVTAMHADVLPRITLADGSTRQAKLVVAADGLHSVARTLLNGEVDAAFSGQVAWRAIVPNAFAHEDIAMVTMGPGRHVVSYPIRGGQLVNLVAVEERAEWAAEGWQHPGDPDDLRHAFRMFGGQVGQMLSAVRRTAVWGLHLHPVAQNWSAQNLVLLGDAAHPTLPFLAQGANMALEDAWVLADEVAKGGEDWARRYQSLREARVRRVVKAAQNNAWRYHLKPGPVRSLAHLGLRAGSQLLPGRMIGAYDWLYRHDVTKGAAQRS